MPDWILSAAGTGAVAGMGLIIVNLVLWRWRDKMPALVAYSIGLGAILIAGQVWTWHLDVAAWAVSVGYWIISLLCGLGVSLAYAFHALTEGWDTLTIRHLTGGDPP